MTVHKKYMTAPFVPPTWVTRLIVEVQAAIAAAHAADVPGPSPLTPTVHWLKGLQASSVPMARFGELVDEGLVPSYVVGDLNGSASDRAISYVRDPSVAALYRASDGPGLSTGQVKVLHAAALDMTQWCEPRTLLGLLAEAGCRDRLNKALELETAHESLVTERDRALAEVAEARESLEAASRGLGDRDEQIASLGHEVATLQAHLGKRDRDLEFLRSATGLVPGELAEAGKTPRRTRVPGEKRIYKTPGGDFEVGWTENGKQRWQIVGADLDAARDLRDSTEERSVA